MDTYYKEIYQLIKKKLEEINEHNDEYEILNFSINIQSDIKQPLYNNITDIIYNYEITLMIYIKKDIRACFTHNLNDEILKTINTYHPHHFFKPIKHSIATKTIHEIPYLELSYFYSAISYIKI